MGVSLIAGYIIDLPLRTLVSEKSSLSTKVISIIAIAVLTCLSLGVYGVHAYNFFAQRKIQDIGRQLRTAVHESDLATVQRLFKAYPCLQKLINPSADFPEKFDHMPDLLHWALFHGDTEIASFFMDNKADLEAPSRAGTPLEVILNTELWNRESRLKSGVDKHQKRIEMIQLLINKLTQLKISYHKEFYKFVTEFAKPLTTETFDIAQILISHMDPNSAETTYSPLYSIARWWPKGEQPAPPELKAFLEFMITKGAHLREDEIQPETLKYVNPQAIKYLQDKGLLQVKS